MIVNAKNVKHLAQTIVNGGRELDKLTPEQWQTIARLLAVSYLKSVRAIKVERISAINTLDELTRQLRAHEAGEKPHKSTFTD